MTGLLLGAGASYELGMPLVWDVTNELKRWLTPNKLRMFNQAWRSNGTGYTDEVISDLIIALENPSLHYESILGYLETQFIGSSPRRSDYHALYSWLIEAVYVILQERHTRNLGYIQKNIHFFDGFQSLVSPSSPLWIFSLNHDLIVECLASHYGIPLSAGFSAQKVSFPKRNKMGKKIGELKGEVLLGEHLENSAMSFFESSKSGINLLKIHGSLDVFTFRDGKDLLRIIPTENSVGAWIECLRAANEELIYVEPSLPGGKVKATNEIAFADKNGEMQFLRRTLLSGAYKFDRRTSQVLPTKLLDHFKWNLNSVSTLICAGYGFGDHHINEVIHDWLRFSPSRKLEIIDPFLKDIPPKFLHLSTQVSLHTMAFTDYLDGRARIQRTRRETLEKGLAAWGRRNQFDPEKKQKFETFVKSFLDKKLQSLVKDIAGLPVKSGDIDVQSIGLTPDELVKDVLSKNNLNMDDMIEQFLKKYK
ncbi:hypothetical protein D3C87_110300 [compost metagenome]